MDLRSLLKYSVGNESQIQNSIDVIYWFPNVLHLGLSGLKNICLLGAIELFLEMLVGQKGYQ